MQTETQQRVSQNCAFLVIFGVLLGMLGVIAIAAPLAAGIAVDVFVGLVAISRGAMQLYYGVKVRHWGQRFGSYMGVGSILAGLLSIVVGALLLVNPVAGLKFLTLVLTVYLIMVGGFEILHAIELSSVQGWIYILASGVLGVALGVMIWLQWPLSGKWAIGVVVGTSLVLSGVSFAMLGVMGRSLLETSTEETNA